MIKQYLKNTNRTWEKCDEFYGNLRYEMPNYKTIKKYRKKKSFFYWKLILLKNNRNLGQM